MRTTEARRYEMDYEETLKFIESYKWNFPLCYRQHCKGKLPISNLHAYTVEQKLDIMYEWEIKLNS